MVSTWPPFARTWPAGAPPAHDGADTVRAAAPPRDTTRDHGTGYLESVAAAALEFCDRTLGVNPHRVGKPLFGPLIGCHGARRGTYRIVYRIDEEKQIVQILDIDHRADAFRPH